MRLVFHIFLRDIRSLIVAPTGAIVAALFALTCGLMFVSNVLDIGAVATMRPMFDLAAWLLLLLCPAITMRLIAEERRIGTWEVLLAFPVGSFGIAKGKFIAAWFFLAIVLTTTFPLVLVLEIYADVDYGAVASGYLGLMLLGGSVIATGLVVSALTTSQTVAYLVTTFFWLTISLATKVLPAYVPTKYADFIFAIDPDLRTAEFAIGLIDTANIVFFLSIILAGGWILVVAIERTRRPLTSIWNIMACVFLLILSLVAINDVSMSEHVRLRLDATGSRAYTLSDQTTHFLDTIHEPWQIVVLLDESTADRAMLKQIDEVLRRYKEGSSFITVHRINPSDPSALQSYDALVRDLIELYGEELTNAERAIHSGIETFKTFMTFASSTSVWAESVAAIASTPQEEETLRTLTNALALLGNEGGQILDEVAKAMQVDGSQPLPQLTYARDILVAATGRWSQELAEVGWWLQHDRSESISSICSSEASAFEKMAITLAQADDSLRRLGALELGQLAAQLSMGEGAVILSPTRATMIPASVLFPKTVGGNQSVSFDQRFRGEHIISSAMRSLNTNIQPTVVFVHSEEDSLLRRRTNNIDLWAARGLLETSRFHVKEWIPFAGPRPDTSGGPTVWVVIPPFTRTGWEISQREQALIDAVRVLIVGNEPIMLNLQPSLLSRYGQKDPWAALVQLVGLSVDTQRVIVEQVAVGPNQLDVQRGQLINQTHGSHIISRAIGGKQIFLPLPIPVQGGDPLIMIEPSEDRWLEDDWDIELLDITSEIAFTVPLPVAAATEHHEGVRAIVVGSGGWMLTWAADRAVSLGGSQVAMINPGNSELLLAAVEWLSGLDDWIAAGPIGKQSSRVSGLSRTAYLLWAAILILGVPSSLLGATAFISIRRHSQ